MKISSIANIFLATLTAITLTIFTSCQDSSFYPQLELSTNKVYISVYGGSATVDITSNCEWKAIESDLVTISPSAGNGNTTMSITVPVTDKTYLEGTIVINTTDDRGPTVTKTIKVIQQDGYVEPNPNPEPEPNPEPNPDPDGTKTYIFDYETLGTSWVNDSEKELAGVNWYINGMKNSGGFGNIGFSCYNEVGGSCYNKTAFGSGISSIIINHKSGELLTVYAGKSENPVSEIITPTATDNIYTYTLPAHYPYVLLKNKSTSYINIDDITIKYTGELANDNGGGTDEPDNTKNVDIEGFKVDANKTTLYTLGAVTVTYCADYNLFVKDASGYLWIYDQYITADAYKAGDVMVGITGNWIIYNGQIELQNPTFPNVEAIPGDTSILEITPAEITERYIGAYALLKDVTIGNSELIHDGASITLYNKFKVEIPIVNSTADVYAIISTYNNLQVYPITFENVVEPELVAGETICTYDNLLTAMGKADVDVDAAVGLEVNDAQYDDFTLTSSMATAIAPLRLWADDKSIRTYSGNTVTITAKSGKKVTYVEFSNSEIAGATVGTTLGTTWSGSADEVTFNNISKAANYYIKIKVE